MKGGEGVENPGMLGAPRPGLSDGQAYCIASLLDMEAKRIHDAVGLLTACIDATRE
ncbi:hypothetical protein [uncultured Slackia sp.]|uniref:hypothetical protein n=1 Tax=uncultured Slackia sp. TaxID=665903 RepID=UPI0026DC690A|nr:hypothetical protein [uncultured Slackia sp.]